MAVVVVVKLLVWAASTTNTVVVVEAFVIDLLVDVRIIMRGVIVIALKSSFPVSYSVDVSWEAIADLSGGILSGVMLRALFGIGVEMLPDVITVTITALECPMSTLLEECSC